MLSTEEYQRTQLLAHGRSSRVSENAHMDMLRRLQKFTADQVFQQCIVSSAQIVQFSGPERNWSRIEKNQWKTIFFQLFGNYAQIESN